MSYDGLKYVENSETAHLGGNINHGDPYTYSPSVVEYLVKRFALRSMLDLGSGQGHTAALFFKLGVIAIACDGLPRNVRNNVYPTVLCDLTERSLVCPVDLVWSQEVAEHIEERYVENYVKSLTNGPIVMITHATPGQGGYHHVNLKEASYWEDLMRAQGYVLGRADTDRLKMLAEKDGSIYIRKSGMLFIKN